MGTGRAKARTREIQESRGMQREGQEREAEEERGGQRRRGKAHDKGHHFKLSLHHPQFTDALPCDSGDHRHNQQDNDQHEDFESSKLNKKSWPLFLDSWALPLLREEIGHTLVEVIGDVHWVSLSGPQYQVAADKVDTGRPHTQA